MKEHQELLIKQQNQLVEKLLQVDVESTQVDRQWIVEALKDI
jgi:hypothetical protein